jgi:hypothetical protein
MVHALSKKHKSKWQKDQLLFQALFMGLSIFIIKKKKSFIEPFQRVE